MWSSDKEDEMKEFVVISDVLHDTVAAHAGVKKVSPFSETLQKVIIHPSFLPSLPPAPSLPAGRYHCESESGEGTLSKTSTESYQQNQT